LRREVRKLIREDKTDAQIKTYLVDRYGDFVLYRPQVKPLTWPLWFGPFFMLLAAVWGLWRYMRLRKNALGQAHAFPRPASNEAATHKD
jgi:cytochrome c-type biogenesis protein CcmH